mmetsp:Transcript_49146/g.97989  ORF Transcript_49146/g.97989 Transcript_49146/m.97989 type:complete len:121 (+) Transcript_49146:419-781(+)
MYMSSPSVDPAWRSSQARGKVAAYAEIEEEHSERLSQPRAASLVRLICGTGGMWHALRVEQAWLVVRVRCSYALRMAELLCMHEPNVTLYDQRMRMCVLVLLCARSLRDSYCGERRCWPS